MMLRFTSQTECIELRRQLQSDYVIKPSHICNLLVMIHY
jgi:hypothetical protein